MVTQNPLVSNFAKSYNSFSGIDIKATFGNRTIGELQAFSHSITREKAPIYTMGSADPRAFSRGKRGIAGTLVFIMFDRHALLEEMRLAGVKFQSDKDDLRPGFVAKGGSAGPQNLSISASRNSARTSETPVGGFGVGVGPGQEAQFGGDIALGHPAMDQELASPWYSDQVPPFDITLSAANEYGALAVMRVFGVEIIQEGYGVSIDDLVSEQTMTYVARTILPWQFVKPTNESIPIGLSASGA